MTRCLFALCLLSDHKLNTAFTHACFAGRAPSIQSSRSGRSHIATLFLGDSPSAHPASAPAISHMSDAAGAASSASASHALHSSSPPSSYRPDSHGIYSYSHSSSSMRARTSSTSMKSLPPTARRDGSLSRAPLSDAHSAITNNGGGGAAGSMISVRGRLASLSGRRSSKAEQVSEEQRLQRDFSLARAAKSIHSADGGLPRSRADSLAGRALRSAVGAVAGAMAAREGQVPHSTISGRRLRSARKLLQYSKSGTGCWTTLCRWSR